MMLWVVLTLKRWPVLRGEPPSALFSLFFVTLQNSVLLVPSSSKSRGLFTLSIPLPPSLFLPRTSSDSPSLFPCFLVFYVRICIFTKSCYRWQSSSSFSSKRCITTYTRADCEREEERERGEEEGARKGRWEVLEHCSADKLMQQSRLTQQRAPNLAQCLREQPGHTGSPAKQKNHTIIKAFHLKLDSLSTSESSNSPWQQRALLLALRRSCPWCRRWNQADEHPLHGMWSFLGGAARKKRNRLSPLLKKKCLVELRIGPHPPHSLSLLLIAPPPSEIG